MTQLKATEGKQPKNTMHHKFAACNNASVVDN